MSRRARSARATVGTDLGQHPVGDRLGELGVEGEVAGVLALEQLVEALGADVGRLQICSIDVLVKPRVPKPSR